MGTRCVLTFLNHPTRGVSLPMDLRVNGALTFPVNSVDNGECRRARLPWRDSHGCALESPPSGGKKQKAGHWARPFRSICDRRLFFEAVFRSRVGLAGGEIAGLVGLERVHGNVFTGGLALGFVG